MVKVKVDGQMYSRVDKNHVLVDGVKIKVWAKWDGSGGYTFKQMYRGRRRKPNIKNWIDIPLYKDVKNNKIKLCISTNTK